MFLAVTSWFIHPFSPSLKKPQRLITYNREGICQVVLDPLVQILQSSAVLWEQTR